MTTDTMRAEAEAIAARHPHVRGTCPPHAAMLHRIASFITENELPPASVSISEDGQYVTVSASLCDLPENVVRRWAQALEIVVDERPFDWQGVASTLFIATGGRDDIAYHVSAIVPIEATA